MSRVLNIVLATLLLAMGILGWLQLRATQSELWVAQNEIAASKEIKPLEISTIISQPLVLITGGNLDWHKRLPETTFALEIIALEVKNFTDSDVFLNRLKIRVDEGQTEIIPIDFLISAQSSREITVRPSLKGFEGGCHRIYLAFLNPNGQVICFRNEKVGPLSVEWQEQK